MEVQVVEKSGIAIFAPVGRIAEGDCIGLTRRVSDELDEPVPGTILDLSGIEYLSSAGVGTILALGQMFIAAKRRLVIADPSSEAAKVLKTVNLAAIMPIFKTVDEAVKYLAG